MVLHHPRGPAMIVLGTLAVLIAAALILPAIPHDPAYHRFVDDRTWMDVPNAGDVVSNIGFLVAGLLGLWGVTGDRARSLFDRPGDGLPYRVFFAGVLFLSAASSYFHLAPDYDRLALDRMAMTVPFMAFFAAFVADRVDRTLGLQLVLPAALAIGSASVGYWLYSETVGLGDLRPYALVQFGPIILLPLICILYPRARYTDARYLAAILAVYLAAKSLEAADAQVFDVTRGLISGHSLKHLVAAVACYLVLPMLRAGRRAAGQD